MKSVRFLLFVSLLILTTFQLNACGKSGGNAVNSSGSGAIPTVSANCNGASCF